jgi:hypothetical protein
MRSHRLNRLALLTQGVALIGVGAADVACSKEPVAEPIHINATAEPQLDASRPPTMNSPYFPPDAGAGAKPDAGK